MTAKSTINELRHMMLDKYITGAENRAIVNAIICVETVQDILSLEKKYESWEIDSADLHIKEGEILKRVKGALR